jgi:hypothetical protein
MFVRGKRLNITALTALILIFLPPYWHRGMTELTIATIAHGVMFPRALESTRHDPDFPFGGEVRANQE